MTRDSNRISKRESIMNSVAEARGLKSDVTPSNEHFEMQLEKPKAELYDTLGHTTVSIGDWRFFYFLLSVSVVFVVSWFSF